MQLSIAAFESVPDPRAENVRDDLGEIPIIAFIAVLCGAQGCAEMAQFGHMKPKFFKRFLKLKHGIPSHDTFSTVFRMIDPQALDAAFGQITARLDPTKGSLTTKLKSAGWNHDILLEMLGRMGRMR